MGEPLFGEALRDARIAAGLSQEELAKRSGYTWATVSTLESVRGIVSHQRRKTARLLTAAVEAASQPTPPPPADELAALRARVERLEKMVDDLTRPVTVALRFGDLGDGATIRDAVLAAIDRAATRGITPRAAAAVEPNEPGDLR